MAKFELKFIDQINETINCKVRQFDNYTLILSLNYGESNTHMSIYLDKSTAIKFAKTLRTEINKIQNEDNG